MNCGSIINTNHKVNYKLFKKNVIFILQSFDSNIGTYDIEKVYLHYIIGTIKCTSIQVDWAYMHYMHLK